MMNTLLAPVKRISGPPGTGKTTRLLEIVDFYLGEGGLRPDQIIYTTFTRSGAHEALNRAARKFNLAKEQFKWFRTIHSLCFRFVPRKKLLTFADLCHVGKKMGVHFTPTMKMDDDTFYGKAKGDLIMNIIHMSRITKQSLEDTWRNLSPYKLDFHEVQLLDQAIKAFKMDHNKLDYTDMLEIFLEIRPEIFAEILIVDEAQDLSPLQWEVIQYLSGHVKRVYVAGDDDQCIHEWNGASSAHFIHMNHEEEEILGHSFRVPRTVHEVAGTLIQRIKDRVIKKYEPRDHVGEVARVGHLSHVNLKEAGSWLILARHTWLLKDAVGECIRQGVLFDCEKVEAGIRREAIIAFQTFFKLRAKETVTKEEAMIMYSMIKSSDPYLDRGAKIRLENAQLDEGVDIEDLQEEFGLCAWEKLGHWTMVLSRMEQKEQDFINQCFQKNMLDWSSVKPPVKITTIHGAKGQEADNVTLLTDLSRTTYTKWLTGHPEEIRVLYVALTRTRNRLFIVNSRTNQCYGI